MAAKGGHEGWVGSRAARGVRCPPLHGRRNLKIHFKKAAKLAHFSSLRRVSDDFCTALYIVRSWFIDGFPLAVVHCLKCSS